MSPLAGVLSSCEATFQHNSDLVRLLLSIVKTGYEDRISGIGSVAAQIRWAKAGAAEQR